MPEPQGIAFGLSNRRPVLQNDPEYDRLLLALRDEQPEALQDDEIAHLQTLSAPNFRTQNGPVADRARLEPAYQSTMERLLTPGRSEGLPVKRGGSEVAQTMGTLADLFVGPELGSGGPTRDAATQRVRDRFAAMSPTERVLSGLTERPLTPRAAIPLRENAQTERPMPPTAGQMVVNAGLGALEALDQPPSKMPTGAPYTTPLRLLSASAAVPSALAGLAYDASGQGSVMADAPVVDPLQPADKQSTFLKAIAERGGGKGAQALGFVADLLTPDFTDVLTSGVPLTAMAGGLKKVNTGRKLIDGFYSRLDEAASMIPTNGVPATAVLNWLKKAPEGISTEEVVYRKLPEWLKSQGTKTVTPEMLAAYLQANPAPFPKVKTLGAKSADAQARYNYLVELGNPEFEARRIVDETYFEPKFSSYQVPGGEAYRETLLTLPATMAKQGRYKVDIVNKDGYTTYSGTDIGSTDVERLRQRYEPDYTVKFEEIETPSGSNFKSSHFPDDPNLLVHTRSNDRTLPTGERIRFGEEAQSDLFQKMKQWNNDQDAMFTAYYKTPDGRVVPLATGSSADEALSRMGQNWRNMPVKIEVGQGMRTDKSPYPDLPFQDTWPDLGLKQMYIEAANDPTIEGIGFTGAKTQINRWGTERLAWEPTGHGGFKVSFEPQVGGNAAGFDMGEEALRRGLIQNSSVTVQSLDDLTKVLGGSDVKAAKAWKRMMAQPEGGLYQPRAEGMTHFYDENAGELRNRAAKIVKPFGGTVEAGEIMPGRQSLEARRTGAREIYTPEPMWFSRLTPEMKAAIKRGLPLMSVLGAAVSAGLLSDAEARQIYRGKPVTGAPQSRKVAGR